MEHRLQYDPTLHLDRNSTEELAHYRFQIQKLEQEKKKQSIEYQAKIRSLQNQTHPNRIFSNKQEYDPNRIGIQLAEKNAQIRQLRTQVMLLSQQQNNPDRLLIKQTNPFDTLAEKNSEIIRLKKVIAGYENKYNGQYFSENKIRKDYDVLLKENQQLRMHVHNLESVQKKIYELPIQNEVMDYLRTKKELELVLHQNKSLKKELLERDTERREKPSEAMLVGTNTLVEQLQNNFKDVTRKNKTLVEQVELLKAHNKALEAEKQAYLKVIPKNIQNINNLDSSIVESRTLIRERDPASAQVETNKRHSSRIFDRARPQYTSQVYEGERQTSTAVKNVGTFQPENAEAPEVSRKTDRYSQFRLEEAIRH